MTGSLWKRNEISRLSPDTSVILWPRISKNSYVESFIGIESPWRLEGTGMPWIAQSTSDISWWQPFLHNGAHIRVHIWWIKKYQCALCTQSQLVFFVLAFTSLMPVSDLRVTLLNCTSSNTTMSNKLDVSCRLLVDFLAESQTYEDSLDGIKLGGIHKWVCAYIEKWHKLGRIDCADRLLIASRFTSR